MEALLDFLSDLTTFTVGLAVIIIWFCIIGIAFIEIYDFLFPEKDDEDV